MRRVQVELGDRSYPVWIGPGAAARAARELRPRPLAVILADARLARQGERLAASLRRQGWRRAEVLAVRAGEELKDFARIYPLYGKLLRLGADRDSVIFALGGGVIGDVAGFVAATYLRGVAWVGVPTTLLAQVDSAIGGKTGVNHALGKNLVGAIHQPEAVACDLGFLGTLPARDRVSGLGEILKYGLILDAPLFESVADRWRRLASRSPGDRLAETIARCVRHKARVVAEDERETTGRRAILNFGHTVGHALEAATRYGHFRHGEAVLLGMRVAADLSARRGHLSAKDNERIQRALSGVPVPAVPAGVTSGKLARLTRRDKKAKEGKARFVLLSRIGRTLIDPEVSERELVASIDAVLFGRTR